MSFIDLGLETEEVRAQVRVGDMVTLDQTARRVGQFVVGKALDDRASVFMQLEVLRQLKDERPRHDVYAVFSTQDQAPTAVPFHYTGNKAVVVFDADGTDDSAIRLAYMWARWVVRRELAVGEAEGLDLECVKSLIGRASQALAQLTQIKKCHTLARKGIDDAQAAAISMVTDVNDALTDLEIELA